MKDKLTILLNTLAQIETKGDSTIKMAASIQHLQQIIAECDAPKPPIPEIDKEV